MAAFEHCNVCKGTGKRGDVTCEACMGERRFYDQQQAVKDAHRVIAQELPRITLALERIAAMLEHPNEDG